MKLSAPAMLDEHHDLVLFDSGEQSLDNWLKKRALANQVSGASRTFVACEGRRVAGYYALASGAVTVASVPGKFRRNMPIRSLLSCSVDWPSIEPGKVRDLADPSFVMRRCASLMPPTQSVSGVSSYMRCPTMPASSISRLASWNVPGSRSILVVNLQDLRVALA